VRDRASVQSAQTLLATLDPTLLFVYFGNVDAAGHARRFDPAAVPYLAAIEEVDAHVARLLEAVRRRPSAAREDWLVLVCTDHGGSGPSHGYFEDPPVCVARTFLIASGPAVRPGLVRDETALVDLVPTVLAHLHVTPDPAWGLTGRSLRR